MKWKTTAVFIIIVLSATVTFTVLYRSQASAGKIADNDAPRQSGDIMTAEPQNRNFTKTCQWFGNVVSMNKVKIKALETGRIISVNLQDGMPVTRHQLLFTLGGPLIENRLKTLQESSVLVRERIKIAKKTVAIKRKAVSQQFAKAEELAAAEDALAGHETDMAGIEQELRQLQDTLNINATIDGVFTGSRVSVGQEVQKGDDLGEIVSLDPVYITATLFPGNQQMDLVGKQAKIDISDTEMIQGTVTRILPRRTDEGATIVWIEGPELASAIRPGQTVTGHLVLKENIKQLAVPQNAIVRDEDEQAYVYLKDLSSFRRQSVTTGMVADGWVEILSGITRTDQVVVQGAYELFYKDFNKIYKVVD